MGATVVSVGQAVCLAVARWAGPGQCYHATTAYSMGYATLAGVAFVAGVIWLVARRRLGA